MSNLARHLERVRSEGIVASLSYYLGTVLLGKLGCQVLYILKAAPTTAVRDDTVECRMLTAWADIAIADRAKLKTYGGDGLTSALLGRFARGDQAVGVYAAGSLTSLLWLHPTNRFRANSGPQMIIQNAFTFPEWRGRGHFRQALLFARERFRQTGDSEAVALYGEVSVSNTSSLKSLRKAGFEKAGWRIVVFGRSHHWLKANGT